MHKYLLATHMLMHPHTVPNNFYPLLTKAWTEQCHLSLSGIGKKGQDSSSWMQNDSATNTKTAWGSNSLETSVILSFKMMPCIDRDPVYIGTDPDHS